MMNKYMLSSYSVALILALTLIGWWPKSIDALSLARPTPYQVVVGAADEFLFVMQPHRDFASRPSAPGASSLLSYPVLGLYHNDGSQTPLWSVDWHAFTVRISSNGRYLVRFGYWRENGNVAALGFYEAGQLLRAYTVEELVR